MEYIVLRRFKSFGIIFHRNEKVTTEQLRSPALYMQEGKIAKIVSSSIIPEQVNADPVQGTEEKDAVSSSNTIAPEIIMQVVTPVQSKEDTNKAVKITVTK